jgi:o-succinylbenzoate synthase
MSFSDLKATYSKHTLIFKQPSGTSRGVLQTKDSYFIHLQSAENPNFTAVGECGLLSGLSIDDVPNYETKLAEVCANIERTEFWLAEGLRAFPSIHFGLEMALLHLHRQSDIFFPSDFTNGKTPIPINGLIWMGEKSFMLEQIREKLADGWRCLKLKIGAIDFEEEIALLRYIRQHFSAAEVELRVDANGAFSATDTLEKLKRLSEFDLHSIEQPIRAGQWDEMAALCDKTPLPIALDEELIGIFEDDQKTELLAHIKPQFLIFKPSFIGGFRGTQAWIDRCETSKTAWWLTSALESNIGLNAIAQWAATLNNPLPQGLGTGQLYTNNFPSNLLVKSGFLHYQPQ